MLRRDISENNIIVTDRRKANRFAGMLIDLDLAKELSSGQAAYDIARAQCSHGDRSTTWYFSYIPTRSRIIFLCASVGLRPPWVGLRTEPNGTTHGGYVHRMIYCSYKEIANRKLGIMDKGKGKGLEVIMKEFPPSFDCVKPLCKVIGDVLFPYKNGLFAETPKDVEFLYLSPELSSLFH